MVTQDTNTTIESLTALRVYLWVVGVFFTDYY